MPVLTRLSGLPGFLYYKFIISFKMIIEIQPDQRSHPGVLRVPDPAGARSQGASGVFFRTNQARGRQKRTSWSGPSAQNSICS